MLGNFRKRKYLDVLAAPMVDPGTTKRSTCHIHPPYQAENDGPSRNLGGRRQKTANGTNPTSTIAFGSSSQALFSKFTVWTIRLGGDVDSTLL